MIRRLVLLSLALILLSGCLQRELVLDETAAERSLIVVVERGFLEHHLERRVVFRQERDEHFASVPGTATPVFSSTDLQLELQRGAQRRSVPLTWGRNELPLRAAAGRVTAVLVSAGPYRGRIALGDLELDATDSPTLMLAGDGSIAGVVVEALSSPEPSE